MPAADVPAGAELPGKVSEIARAPMSIAGFACNHRVSHKRSVHKSATRIAPILSCYRLNLIPTFNGVAMLPRLLLVVGLSVGVMLPLIWAAFAPVLIYAKSRNLTLIPVHNGSAGADWREGLDTGSAEPSNSTARSNETTIGTAPQSEGEASAARSDDLPPAGLSEPTLIKPNPPRTYDREAAPEPLGN